MIYTVFPKNIDPSDMPQDFASYKLAIQYCREKDYVVGVDCEIESTEGNVEQ